MDSERRDYLLVDGHNIIFAWPELRALHQGPRRAAARDALIRRLTEYQDCSGVRVVLVFDGQGEGARASEATEPGGIQVFYAPSGRTADDTIERLVAKYAHQHRLTVATTDALERQTAFAFGAESCVGPEELRRRLEDVARDFARRLRNRSTDPRSPWR